mmetsp:Transcript_12932/g.17320  ORF Transcript_12932/g.17320 Transcript_12932/m.17320 type:complete len:152 (+) Transcript_12932:228-683(+)
MIHFILMLNKQGNTRLVKFFNSQMSDPQKKELEHDVYKSVISREKDAANVCTVNKYTIAFRRYVSLYVCLGIDDDDNELLALETIHNFIEILNSYFGTVRELDIIYQFSTVHMILDEYILAGQVIESNHNAILSRLQAMPQLTINKATTAS